MITSCKSQLFWQIMLDLITWSFVLSQTYFTNLITWMLVVKYTLYLNINIQNSNVPEFSVLIDLISFPFFCFLCFSLA